MLVSAIIFDCDGVMFDSREANLNFYNHILAHFGLPLLTGEDIEFVHTHTAMESLNHIFRESPFLARAHEYRLKLDYTPFIKDMVMEPGLKEVLDFLKPRYGLAVATNRSTTIGKVLELNGLSHYFDLVVSSLDVKNPKPHPESIFKIADFFGIRPDESLYVGDSLVDYETARSAGVGFISYKNRELDADYHVHCLMDIAGLLNPRCPDGMSRRR
jgi:phosphoglycolate phosphatase